jgi:sporulation protein YlmC with PRC-barrel domain
MSYTIRTTVAVVALLSVSGLAVACDPPVYYPQSYTSAPVYVPAQPASVPAPPVNGVIPAAGTSAPVDAPAATNHAFRAKQILGTKIMIQNGTAIGTVDDLVFDEAGNMEYLLVSTGDNKLITVPWDAAKWDLEKKTGTVNITQDVYKTIPTYTTTTYPQFYTPTYRTQVYRAYGLTPRDLRRIERRLP